MTWRDVEDLFDYWRDYPPLHQLVAIMFGFKPSDEVDEAALNPAEMMARYRDTQGKAIG